MLLILSPAKRMDAGINRPITEKYSRPDLTRQTEKLISLLKTYTPAQLGSLLNISDQLAVLNAERYAEWTADPDPANSKPAIYAYDGDVYRGLDAKTFNESQIDYAQSRVRILSGLYGVLRPLDLIQPYRLEMGVKLMHPGGGLYGFWRSAVTKAIGGELERGGSNTLVNLASEEYCRVIDADRLNANTISPVFQDWHNGKWKIIPVHAKRARGLMARFAIVNMIAEAHLLKSFGSEGYAFDSDASSDSKWVFRRHQGSRFRQRHDEAYQ